MSWLKAVTVEVYDKVDRAVTVQVYEKADSCSITDVIFSRASDLLAANMRGQIKLFDLRYLYICKHILGFKFLYSHFPLGCTSKVHKTNTD